MVVVQEDYHSEASPSNFPQLVLRAVLDLMCCTKQREGGGSGSCCSSYLVSLHVVQRLQLEENIKNA